MKPIEVYTISKTTVMCHDINYYEVNTFDCDKYQVNRLGEPSEATINREFWKIKRFTECRKNIYDEIGRWDTYIAVEPKLEKLLTDELTQKYDAKLDRLSENLNLSQSALGRLESSVRNFISLPWYKRIWKAIKKEIIL